MPLISGVTYSKSIRLVPLSLVEVEVTWDFCRVAFISCSCIEVAKDSCDVLRWFMSDRAFVT